MERATIGVDIGGTKIAAGVVSPDGAVLHASTRATPSRDGAAAVCGAAAELAVEMKTWARLQSTDVTACGVGTAGTVSPSGVVTHATASLPGWVGTDVAKTMADAVGLPVSVLNDVQAMALGESRFGAAAGSAHALVVAVGTGIGGAVVRSGQVGLGRTGSAGAIGHMPAPRPDLKLCPCGRSGHVEAYASGPAIVSRYVELGGTATSLQEVAARALAAEKLAQTVIDEAAWTLGRVLGGVANLLDPEVIVIGGGASLLGDLFLSPLRRGIRTETLTGPDSVRVTSAGLGRLNGVIGAAVAACDPERGGASAPEEDAVPQHRQELP